MARLIRREELPKTTLHLIARPRLVQFEDERCNRHELLHVDLLALVVIVAATFDYATRETLYVARRLQGAQLVGHVQPAQIRLGDVEVVHAVCLQLLIMIAQLGDSVRRCRAYVYRADVRHGAEQQDE